MLTEKRTAVIEKTSPDKFTVLLAIIVSSLLSIGFSLMFGTAFRFGFSIVTVLLWSILGTVFFALIHCIKNKYVMIGALVLPALALLIMIVFDIFDAKIGWNAFLYYVQKNAYYQLPGEYRAPAGSKELILMILMIYDLTAISITTCTIIKRRWIPASLILYIPEFALAVKNVNLTPQQAPVICAATGVLALIIVHALRNKKRATAEKVLLVLLVPSFVFAFGLGLIFPKKGYTQDQIAKTFLADVKEFVGHVTSFSDNPALNFIDTMINGVRDPDADREQVSSNQFVALYPSNKDLSKVGPFNPAQGKILQIYKDTNPDYDYSIPSYDGPCIYLKVESLDTYRNNTLSRANLRIEPYKDNADIESMNCKYTYTITPLTDSTVSIVPYYSDFYVSEGQGYSTVSCYNTIDIEEDRSYFAMSVPVKGDFYTDEYIEDYVYGVALEVPERTRDAIAMSGDLPDWYMECYLGRSDMSDCDKVRAVTQYVSELHPYDRHTEYTPHDVDFVPWFISDAETGICVHYAATTVVLLRMIGIPARYVSGFMDTRTYPDSMNIVYAEQAHAWFEFFVPGYGWIMGDATPGNGMFAANFNIDAVASAYPEIEDASFSRNRYGNSNQTAVPTGSPEGDPTMPSTTYSVDASGNLVDENGNIVNFDQMQMEVVYDDNGNIIGLRAPGGSASSGNSIDWATFVDKALEIVQVVLEIILVLLAFCVIKGIYTAFWVLKFRNKNLGERVIAYYRYYKFVNGLLRKRLPVRAVEVVEKVAYSHEVITKDDVATFVKACKKSTNMLVRRLPVYKRILFSFVLIKVRH